MKDEEIMELARKIVQKKRDFTVNAISYVAVNAMLVMIWFTTGRGYFWPIWPMLGWGLGLAIHGVDLFRYSNGGGYQDQVEREYQRLKKNL